MPPAGNPAVNPWEETICAFEAADRAQMPAPGQVLFTGSSSIAVWPDLAVDFAPLPVFGRGFGGSTMADLRYYTDRVILPYRPRAVVMYEGDNDIASGRTPAQVADDALAIITRVRAVLPAVRLYVLSVKLSPSRGAMWPLFRDVNAGLAALAAETPHAAFVDITAAMAGPDGRTRTDLFVEDMLHMNAAGYAAWTGVLKILLMRDCL